MPPVWAKRLRCLVLAGLLLTVAAYGQPVVVTVLATTDLHGNLYPIDYGTDQPAPRGLAKIATLIRAAESENPNHLLIDCGDTIQGSPLEYVYQTIVRTGAGPAGLKAPAGLDHDPMMLAMNRLGYDSMTVGNHEYNFGLKNFDRARSEARFPWISANTSVAPGGKERPFAPYLVKVVGGVKVAIVGITTPAVPTWEKPENLGSYRFRPAVESLRKAVAELRTREHPDVIVVAAHSGMGRNLETGQEESSAEDVTYELATQVPEVDAIVFGHSHREMPGRTIGKVLVVQPKNWGISLARLDFTLERKAEGGWTVRHKTARLMPVTAETAAAPDILAIAKPYHELAERHLDMPVANSPVEMNSALGRVEDTPVVDSVQEVERFYSKADVSFASVFNPSVRVPKGQVTVRQIAALYPYDNQLFVIEGTGKMVKDALENAARYFVSCDGERCSKSPLTNSKVLGYNYDIAEGVEYEVDLTRPEGDRIRNLRWHSKPLDPGQKLRIAINSYRAGGSAGYDMYVGAKVVWRSQDEIRDMMVRYYTEEPLPTRANGNWRIVPETARHTLEKEALAEAAKQHLQ